MKKIVLVADDQEELLNVIVRQIELLGFEVVAATSAAEALARFRVHAPRVVISDCNMPGLEPTIEMVRTIKSEAQNTLVIMMSGNSVLSLEWAKSIGADYFLEKPFRPEALEDILLTAFVVQESVLDAEK